VLAFHWEGPFALIVLKGAKQTTGLFNKFNSDASQRISPEGEIVDFSTGEGSSGEI